MKQLSLFILSMGLFFMTSAQVQTPAPSPSSSIKQTIGLTEFTVEYSRPSVKGRKIFGGLVPYGEMWRTGANGSTDFTASEAFEFAGTKVEAGTYAIYSVPNENAWEVFLYQDASFWGTPPADKFDEDMVVAKSTVKPTKLNHTVESFTITFDHLRNGSGHLVLKWDDTMVQVPIEVYTQDAVTKSISDTFEGPSANDYYRAGNYYFEENLDMEKALMWVSKAVELRPDAFWMMRTKAEILGKMGKYDEAIATAKMSAEAAEKAGNMQYVKFNQDNIERWMKAK